MLGGLAAGGAATAERIGASGAGGTGAMQRALPGGLAIGGSEKGALPSTAAIPVSPLLTATPPYQLSLREASRPGGKSNSFFMLRKSVHKFAIA